MTQPTQTDPHASTPPAEEPQQSQPRGKSYSQDELNEIIQERLAQAKRQHADESKELKARAAEADRLKKERETETEKAIREAREQARAEALRETAPRLVLAEMRAAAAGRIDPDRFDTLTEDLDLSRYLTEAGGVDIERVQRKVAAWAPVAPQQDQVEQPPAEQQPRRPRPDPTQGAARTHSGDVDRGLEEARKRFGDRARIS